MNPMMRVLFVGTLSVLAGATLSYAQMTVDPDAERTAPREPMRDERMPQEPIVQDPVAAERVVVQERVVERKRAGEVYVAGFGGFTLGHSFSNVAGRGTLADQPVGDFDLANSVIYGMKVGYFHPGRLSWLGFEVEGFNTTPHMKQQNNFPGSNLRVATLAFNVIARTRLACRDRDDRDYKRARQRTTSKDARQRTTSKDDGAHYYEDDSTADDNAKCPLHVYAGAGPGIFFAETSNQFGRSTDNAEVGVNAMVGMKYFMHRNVSVFGEYKYNYAGFDFTQLQGPTAGVQGNYSASHFVGGLAVHF
jgi:opacity protein-like surface antigen